MTIDNDKVRLLTRTLEIQGGSAHYALSLIHI